MIWCASVVLPQPGGPGDEVERELRQATAEHLVQARHASGQAIDGYLRCHGDMSCAGGPLKECSHTERSNFSVREGPIRLARISWNVCKTALPPAAASAPLCCARTDFSAVGIHGRLDAFLAGRRPWVERNGEVEAARVDGGHAPLPDDGRQRGIDLLQYGSDRFSDLRGIRSFPDSVVHLGADPTVLLVSDRHDLLRGGGVAPRYSLRLGASTLEPTRWRRQVRARHTQGEGLGGGPRPGAYSQYSQARASSSLTRRSSGRRCHCSSVMASDAARSLSNIACTCLPNSAPSTTAFNS